MIGKNRCSFLLKTNKLLGEFSLKRSFEENNRIITNSRLKKSLKKLLTEKVNNMKNANIGNNFSFL